jgi:hypothetical protein
VVPSVLGHGCLSARTAYRWSAAATWRHPQARLACPTVRALSGRQKSQAIALGNLTLSLIRQRKLDEAAAMMHRTIDTVELTRGGGGLNLAFTAGRELRQWRQERWVQDINDRLFDLMAAS